ncbi:MAG: Stp1/IreP family PP2C-type Ser/Thr phosphatase [Actinomycetota bacterium]
MSPMSGEQLVFRWGASTHAGRVRAANQDSVFAQAPLFIVADGMGGHRAGETASRLTVESLSASTFDDLDGFVEAVRETNRYVHQSASDDSELQGMGTTVTAMRIAGSHEAALINVGDSRAYRLRGETFERLTEDHSYVGALLREGSISEQEAEMHPYRNMLTRAIGIEPEVEVDSWSLELEAGDRYLLCSDGLINELQDDQVQAALRRLADPGDAARELVRLANDRGGRDNITVVVVDVVADDGEATAQVAVVGDDAAPPAEEDLDPTEQLPALDGPDAPPPPSPFADTATVTDTQPFADLADERAGVAPPAGDDGPAEPTTPLLTWRLLGFVVLVIVAIFGAIAAVGFWARSGAHLDFAGDEVVIFEGKSGSVLWFEPTLVERTAIFRDELPEAIVEDIDGGREVGSLGEARDIVADLRAELPPPTTTPPPTTAPPPTEAPPSTATTAAPATTAPPTTTSG